MQMAEAVAAAMEDGAHLLVQAGTGTGKSLGYLVPALLHDDRVVVATATLALQHQLVERDIPALVEAAGTARRRRRRTPCSRAGPTTPACTASARACPTTRARSSSSPRGRWAPRWSRCASGSRRRPSDGGTRRARQRARGTPTASGARSASATASASAPPSARSAQECFAERAKERAAPLAADRHQPLAARDRRDRGRPDDPGVRRRGDRRGPRARRPGDPGRHRRAARSPSRARRPTRRSATSRASEADDLADAGEALRDAHRRQPARAASTGARASSPTRWRWSATPPGPWSRRSRKDDPAATTPGTTQAKGWAQELFATAERMAAGSDKRRAVDDRARAQPRRQPAAACAAAGVGPDARQAARREDGRLHLRHPQARRRLRRGRHVARAQAGGAGAAEPDRAPSRRRRCRGAASTSARRSTTASRRSSTSPATCPRPAATGCAGPARRDRRPRRRRRRAHPRAVLQPPGGRGRRRGTSASGCPT